MSDDETGSEGSTEPTEPTEHEQLEALRDENRRLEEQLGEVMEDEEAVRVRRTRTRRRRASIALAVVAALLLPPAVMTVWVRNRLLDTDIYLETVEPLATDPAIQDAVAARITTEVSDAVDLKTVAADLLPEEASPLAGIIAAGGNNLIGQLADSAVKSDQFAEVWNFANEEAHKTLVLALTGGEGDVLDFSDGKVVLPLDKLVATVLDGIDSATGLDLADQVPADSIDSEFVLFESEDLADMQSAVKLFDQLSWFLVIATLLALGGAILVAPDRRLGVRRVGIAVAVPMVLTLVLMGLAREAYLGALVGVVESQAAAAAAFDIITNFLRMSMRAALGLGVVLIAGAWLVGPSRAAVTVRGWGQALLGRVDQRTGERDLGPVPRWVDAHQGALTWVAVGIGAVVLVSWQNPDGLVVLLIAAIVAAAVGLIRLVASVARPEPVGPGSEPAPEGVGQLEATGTAEGRVPDSLP